MLRIRCPNCGIRDEQEFHYGGELRAEQPSSTADDAEWADYLFNRENIKGPHIERWCHSFGCGEWFYTLRNTITHELIAIFQVGEERLARLELEATVRDTSS